MMSIATPPFSPPKLQMPASPEPSWEIVKLFPNQGNWSETEYLTLADTNRLVELSDGSIKVIDMPTDLHQAILSFLFLALHSFVNDRKLGKVRFAAMPVKLWQGKFREPDLLFMSTEHDERRHNQFWDGADLVMEVVSEDRAHDLQTKRDEYARGGIPEYWIVDPMLKEITVLKLAVDHYEPAGVYHPGEQAASVLLAGFAVDATAVFEAR
jgi:Uma2 family endonuclease